MAADQIEWALAHYSSPAPREKKGSPAMREHRDGAIVDDIERKVSLR